VSKMVLKKLAIASMMVLVGGCGPTKLASSRFVAWDEANGEIGQVVGAEWRVEGWQTLEPHSIRLHPLSRVEGGDGQARRAVVMVELRDEFEHTTKGLGVLAVLASGRAEARVEESQRGQRTENAPHGQWIVLDLRDPMKNAEAFDSITRTYEVVVDEYLGAGDIVVRWYQSAREVGSKLSDGGLANVLETRGKLAETK
jgi:hypothetical protein